MADSSGSMTSGLTAAINQTFSFGKIIVMGSAVIVGTAFALLLGWIAGLGGLQKPSLQFLCYIFRMVGIMGAFYVVLAAMVAVAKMAAADASGKAMGFIGGFAVMTKNLVKVVFATLVPVAVLAVSVALLWIIGLIGCIPKVGPFFWSIAAIVPIIIGLIAAFVLVKLFLTVFLVPGIIATTDQSGYQCYKNASGMVKTRLIKLLTWFIVVFILVTLFFTIMANGISIMQTHTTKTMGQNSAVMGSAKVLRVLSTQAINIGNYSIVPRGLTPQWTGAEGGVIKTAGWFYGIELGVVLAILLACGYIFFSIGGMYAYSALSSEPENPIALKMPINIDNITAKAAKFTENVSEKIKAEVSEEDQGKKKGAKK